MRRHFSKNLVIVLALASALGLVVVRRVLPYVEQRTTYTDGERVYEAVRGAGVRHAVWDPPLALGGDVNTPSEEGGPALSPDGRLLVFAVGEEGLNADLWVAEMVGGAARDPRPLDELNSPADDLAPAFGPDGLYFASNRAGGEGGFDVWIAALDGPGFRAPRPAPAGVNSPADERDPAPIDLGLVEPGIAFASNRADGGRGDHDLFLAWSDGAPPPALGAVASDAGPEATDLEPYAESSAPDEDAEAVVATAPDGEPSDRWRTAPLEALNSPGEDRDPAFTIDGRTAFFASDRGREDGSFDLYRSVLRAGEWLPPEALAGLNTAASERSPSPSTDGFALLFERTEGARYDDAGAELAPAAAADIYLARSRELFPLPPAAPGWMDLILLAALLLLALLAWLAKRWKTLDVIYTCFLVSVLLHMLLMWLFGDVYPEGDPRELGPGREPAFRVRMLSDRDPAAALRERGGRLEAAPTEITLASAQPTRVASESDPAPMEASGARAFERPTLERAPAPTRAESAPAERPAESLPAEAPRLADAGPAIERFRDAAPAVDPGRARSSTVTPQLAAESAPERVQGPSPASTAAAPTAAPRRELTVNGASPLPEAAAFQGATDGRAPRVATAADAPRVDAPAEAIERIAAGAPASAAPAPSSELERPVAESSLAAERWETAVPAGGAPPTELSPELPRELSLASAATPLPSAPERGAGAPLERTLFAGAADSPTPEAPLEPELEAERIARAAPTAAEPDPVSTIAARERAEPAPALPVRATSAPEPEPAPLPEPTPRRIARLEPAPPALAPRPDASAPVRPVRMQLDAPAVALPSEPIARAREATADPEPLRDLLAAAPKRFEAKKPTLAPERPAPLRRPELPDGEPESLAPERRPLAAVERAPEPERPLARVERTPYRARFGTEKEVALETYGGTEETEAAVKHGLAYLASRQRPNGQWGDPRYRHSKYREVHVGKTGLALLAFLGAGHTHQSRTEHSDVVARALSFLLSQQSGRTGQFGDTSSYSHGIATYALAECYAITRDPSLRPPLERAVERILDTQVARGPARLRGGWRYYYPDGDEFDGWPRVSITAWQVMALKSARIGGLDVPERSFDAAHGFLLGSWDGRLGAMRYSHDPDRLRSGYPTLPGSTPAGLFALALLGEDVAGEEYAGHRDFVRRRRPGGYRLRSDDRFVSHGEGNLYFWYYGTLASFFVGGGAWRRWNEDLQETLLPSQADDGSWRPISIYAEYAGDSDGDRVYSTAMCVLCLEVYYRYFTPLLQKR